MNIYDDQKPAPDTADLLRQAARIANGRVFDSPGTTSVSNHDAIIRALYDLAREQHAALVHNTCDPLCHRIGSFRCLNCLKREAAIAKGEYLK